MKVKEALDILGYPERIRTRRQAMAYTGTRIIGVNPSRCGDSGHYAKWSNDFGHVEWHPCSDPEEIFEALETINN